MRCCRFFPLCSGVSDEKKIADLSKPEKIRRGYWTKAILATLPSVIFGIFTVIFTLQQNSASRATREQDQQQANAQTKRDIFDNYIDVISDRLLNAQFNRNNHDHLQTIRVKTITILRHLDWEYKRDIIFFLHENNLIRTDLPFEKRLNLDGANLSGGVQFVRSPTNRCNLENLYLPGVFASEIVFNGCELKGSIFDGSVLTQSQFINCSLEHSFFINSILDRATFHNTDLDGINFIDASLKQTTFFDGIFEEIDLTNADLLGSNLTDDELTKFYGTTKAHVILNTRFPNGSFSRIDSTQLVKDGGTERECTDDGLSNWGKLSGKSRWIRIKGKHKTMDIFTPKSMKDDCYFFANQTSGNYQQMNVKRFSLLIDNGEAWCNLSAYMGCFHAHSTNEVEVNLRFINARNMSNTSLSLVMATRNTPFQFATEIRRIPPDTRLISVRPSAIINQTMVANIAQYCVINDINVFIFDRKQDKRALR